MRAKRLYFILAAPTLALACSAGSDDDGTGASTAQGAGDQGGGGATTAVTATTQASGFNVGGMGQGGGINCTPLGPDDDVDQDGFTPNQGDCEDCDPNRNPNAIEAPTEEGQTPYDENCNDEIDEEVPEVLCDDGIAIDEMDPLMAAAAVDICKTSTGPLDWGVADAKWVLADGSEPTTLSSSQLQAFHLGHGFLDRWGPNIDVRKGERMLVVSSGRARQPIDPGYESPNQSDKLYECAHPQGFPKESPACPGVVTGEPHDATGVELTLHAPSNASGISFDFNFYTYEWPDFVCNQYNDFFVAILDPIPMGQMDGNISFDSQGNPVSVNNALLRVCGCYEQDMDPFATCEAGGKIFECDLGNIELVGTGFGFDTEGQHNHHGATSWLRTQAPIPPGGEIKIRFATYDSGDGVLSSTTLVDNFKWILKPGVMVGTNPVPQ